MYGNLEMEAFVSTFRNLQDSRTRGFFRNCYNLKHLHMLSKKYGKY